MPRYCVNTNAQPNGDHEVHVLNNTCSYLPDPVNREDLGYHDTCSTAVSQAKRRYSTANGCAWCSSPCHTS